MKNSRFNLPFVNELEKRLKSKKKLLIQVVAGPRQVGKTTGMLQCLKRVKLPHHFVSADDVLNPSAEWFFEQWQMARQLGANTILVVDEIQKVPNWSKVVKGLWDKQTRESKNKLRVILLGSSSLGIQRGLSESLTGRYELITVSHWTYSQSKKIHKFSLDDYLNFGGYPGSYEFISEPKRWWTYLKNSIVDTVITKDILNDVRVKSPALFKQAFEILCQYPAQEISYNKLLGQIQDKGNVDLIKNYIELYAGAYLITALEKYSEKAVVKKSSSPKILPLCPSLVTFATGFIESSEQKGRLFELAVAMELYRLPGDLYYWRDGKFELDFVYKLGKNLFAIEVKSGSKKSPKGLAEFCRRFPKAKPMIITPDNFEKLSEQGADFLK
jgi:uncharacterized protein